MVYVYNFLSILQQLLISLIFIRVILVWFGVRSKFLNDTTEWILAPLRSVVPKIGGMLDFSPLVAILLIEFGGNFILNLLGNLFL